MSFDIFWDKLDKQVAQKVQDIINEQFRTSNNKPSFIGDIEISEFDFGTVPPSIEIIDVTDPFPEFYLPDNTVVDVDAKSDLSESGGNVNGVGSGVRNGNGGIGGGIGVERVRTRESVVNSEQRTFHHNNSSSSFTRSNPLNNNNNNNNRSSPFTPPITPINRSSSFTTTPITPINRSSPFTTAPITPVNRSSPFTTTPIPPINRSSSFTTTPIPPINRSSSFTTTPITPITPIISPSIVTDSSVDYLNYQRQQQRLREQARNDEIPLHLREDYKDYNIQIDDQTQYEPSNSEGEEVPLKQDTDAQIHIEVSYKGNMKMVICTELYMNYPSLMFMSLPVRLTITGFEFSATAVVAYLRNRVNFCFLEPKNPEESHLKEVYIESEIGDKEKQVLKNVGKLEKFIIDQLRKIIDEDFVFPSYHSIEL
ncbi:hypothetical protein RhiirA5_471674 [Rhizophagus irregularis]|uniref:Mitochondrial distribution and morphology protein 12 n=3 Tax=Rhizophagus irregularis TaxID=588596 RepID=A0A2I1E6P9_9GLOM|nr:hypothetical protein RhiirA5_471674 [Rhizophagus irregularis]PKC75494.1 hypothetical protein RhiirA1_500478 [Rhizophagus irregularis]PKY17800.1 hypothetical protein RhiirB3_488984 [Rhizophagus irregularis]UZO29084.1 hypothetical protein OCT59_022576 [Rhizophagus irregularis]CAB4486478.1 unnamed protein product [Rhizophagus irregularis]